MATHNITINEGGKPTPQQINVEPEDMVRFEVVGSQDVLLCLDSQVFEKERIEIYAGDTVAVQVKANAPHRSFEYWSCNAADASGLNCSDIRTKNVGDTGGGSVGGGG